MCELSNLAGSCEVIDQYYELHPSFPLSSLLHVEYVRLKVEVKYIVKY